MKYTRKQFLKDYPDADQCLEKLFKMRYGHLEACPACGVCNPRFTRIRTRRSFQCADCYHQIYPTAGTVFHRTRVPLDDWFYVMYLMTYNRKGVSAKQIKEEIGVSSYTAWRVGHIVRKLMAAKPCDDRMLSGHVEIDETLIGGKEKNKHRNKRTPGTQGMSLKVKSAVVGMVERTGEVRAVMVPNLEASTVLSLVANNVELQAVISTDEAKVYSQLSEIGYDHGFVNHRREQYKNDVFCTNAVEGFFSCLKRSINGTYIHVSKRYLQNYIDETCYRYNHRGSTRGMQFTDLLQLIPLSVPIAAAGLRSPPYG